MLDALLPAVHPRRGRLPAAAARRRRALVGDVRDPRDRRPARCAGVDAVCHQAAMVGLGVDVQDMPDYAGINGLGTAVLLAAMARGGRRPAGAGQLDGGLRRGPLRLPGARRRAGGTPAPRPTSTRAASSRRARVCGRQLALGRGRRGAPRRPAQHLRRDEARARSTWPPPGPPSTGGGAVALRYHNVYGPRMPRDTPYAGVAAIFRSALEARPGAAGVRGRRPAARLRARHRRGRGQPARARRRAAGAVAARLQRRLGAAAHGRRHGRGRSPAAFGGPEPVVTGAVPPRRRPARRRQSRAGPRGAGLPRRASSFADGMRAFATAPLRPAARPIRRRTRDRTPRMTTHTCVGRRRRPALPGRGGRAAVGAVPAARPATAPIVADNGSTDGSAEVAAALGATVVRVPQRGFGAAAHAGLEAATADVVCFCDADGSMDPARAAARRGARSPPGDADLVLGRRRPDRRRRVAAARPGGQPSRSTVLLRRRTGLRLHDLGPMRAARRADAARPAARRPPLRLPAGDGHPRRPTPAGGCARSTSPTRPRTEGSRSKVTGTVLGTVRTVRDMRAVLAR